MSSGSHRGCRPDSIYSCFEWSQSVRPECISVRPESVSSSEWSQYVRPEFRRKVEMEWQMMRRRDLEMYRQNMQRRNQLGSSLGHFNNLQQANISSLGKRNAQGDEVRIQNRPDLEQAEIDAHNAYDKRKRLEAERKRLEAALMDHFKRQQEVNDATPDVDLTLRMWFQEEGECMKEPNKKPKNA